MPKKKVNFESDVLKQEFAVSKSAKHKKYYYYIIYAVIAVMLCVAVGYYIYKKSTSFNVDWYAYGKALASIEESYDDYDRVIISVGDEVKVTKEEYYKLKILSDYTFNGLMAEYNKYIKKNAGSITDEEKEKLKPTRVTDEDILDSIIDMEVGYLEAKASGVHMNYAVAYSQINASYLTYKNIMEEYSPDTEIYVSARDSIEQMELVASGMGYTIDEYIEYLANDSIKKFACSLLEERWQAEFKTSDFTGTVDEYVTSKYADIRAKYSVVNYGLEK